MVTEAAPVPGFVATPALSADVIRALEASLLAYALRAVGNRDQARDLVQETLLAVTAGRAPFEGRSQLRTWAIGTLTHKVVDLLRARGRARLTSAEDTSVDDLAEPSSEGRPDRVLERREALSIVDAALRELPDLERLAVLLVDVEGNDHEKTCNELAVNATHLRCYSIGGGTACDERSKKRG
jgi:RNA polymerase sigma-70 factor (ECF subfamily)